jgi:hypothetical protein
MAMARALFAVGALLAVLILGLGLVAWLGRPDEKLVVDNMLSENLTRDVATADREGSNLELANTTDFPWDKVLIVQRGTPREEISRKLGTEWKGDVGYDAGDLFLFLDDGQVQKFANYRGKARFEGLTRPFAEFTPTNAVFVVNDQVVQPRDHGGR